MPETLSHPLKGLQVMLGITGGIAAYKTPFLVRGLVNQGAEVRVVMTRNAGHFVTPLTLQTLSGSPVLTEMFEPGAGPFMPHIEWTRDTDLVVIAPATANIIGKMAGGIADDLLSTMVLTVEAPLLIAPSMNPRMYTHPAVVDNMNHLRERGVHILEPEVGELACGDQGMGRMADVEKILNTLQSLITLSSPLAGKHILVTAGPTEEPIDPVRYLCNRSSGKMGYAIAVEASRMGGQVTLVSGPTSLTPPGGVTSVHVRTALEMQEQVKKLFPKTDLLIMAAAVGDYRLLSPRKEKIKRDEGGMTLQLESNPDILKEIAQHRKNQVLVGFAAETENLEQKARSKLQEKGVDLLVANDVSEPGVGFDSDSNSVIFLDRNGLFEATGVLPKAEIARKLLRLVGERYFSDSVNNEAGSDDPGER